MAERVALVTGAARGIGAATSVRLAHDGYHVIALDLCSGGPSESPYPLATEVDLEQVVAAGAGRIVPFVGDVRVQADVHAAATLALDRWGGLDATVAGAAIILGGNPQWKTSAGDLDQLWQSDFVGVWNTAQAVLPIMLAAPRRDGRFVAVASAAGHRGLYGLSAYCAVKHAVIGLVRGLAADLTGTGVTAVAVAPGSTDTPMLQATADLYGVAADELASHQYLGRMIDPAEIAATIALCCSPEGAILNGSVVHADGGFHG